MPDWNDVRADSKARRGHNRAKSAQLLSDAGIEFESHNNGAHLLVAGGSWECWPGTGRWRHRSLPIEGRGVASLITAIKGG